MKHELAAWAGIIGPALFVAVFIMEGWLRPGYDPLSMAVSELSLGERGWIQVASFLVTGALFLVFARGVADEFKEGTASKADYTSDCHRFRHACFRSFRDGPCEHSPRPVELAWDSPSTTRGNRIYAYAG